MATTVWPASALFGPYLAVEEHRLDHNWRPDRVSLSGLG